ncbi:hypothetical protein Halar_3188 [halophilic archaeon DL31]|jgi:hypothetical protein|nr:hypothetical protein Halar_2275 [halophilic archaeon DL31]AEN06804.1 hypothetical protein Halar_3188 [halophilic archaeon DL31]
MTDRNNDNRNENATEKSQSRRGFMTKSAVAGGALLTLGGGAGVALADEQTMMDKMMSTEASFDDVEGTDIDVLNYALALEHLESAFYKEGMETFDENAFVEAESLQAFTEEHRRMLYGYLGTVGDHEAKHVEVLTQVVKMLGGEPVAAAEYDFGFEDVGGFLSLGAVLENTGVAAYAGAAPFVESPDLVGAAMSIHSVEARHAAVLNMITGTSPFPNAFDSASSQSDVLEAVSQFIVEETETSTDDETATEEESETATETGNETVTEAGNETATETEYETATETGNETATENGNWTTEADDN